ncbi:hypothetical protein [Streptomyces sp. NPDC003401]
MTMKDHANESQADAAALYASTLGVTSKNTAADPGIDRATLREWVLRDRGRRGTTTSTAAGRTPATTVRGL